MEITAHKLFTSINNYVPLSEDDFLVMLEYTRTIKLKRKQFFLHTGMIAKEAAFVLSGCLKAYSIDDEGNDHILQFAPENWWITDMYSFISQKETHTIIECVNEAEILLLSRENQLKLFDMIPAIERYFRILTEKNLVALRQRLMDNMSLTALQRYHNFCTIYPTLIDNIPQKYIASYIGVTPEFLSKMKNQELRNK